MYTLNIFQRAIFFLWLHNNLFWSVIPFSFNHEPHKMILFSMLKTILFLIHKICDIFFLLIFSFLWWKGWKKMKKYLHKKDNQNGTMRRESVRQKAELLQTSWTNNEGKKIFVFYLSTRGFEMMLLILIFFNEIDL